MHWTSGFIAQAVQLDKDDPHSWYVFWRAGGAYGARGSRMTEQRARALAERMTNGARWDVVA